MLISRLPNPNILQQSEPNGLKLWIITVNWGIKMLDFCQILKWPVSKSYWKLVLFFENNDIFSFILYHHASNAGVDLWRCVDTQISTAVVTHCHINRDLKCLDDVCPSRCSTLMSGSWSHQAPAPCTPDVWWWWHRLVLVLVLEVVTWHPS